jgi:hypothetical protein
LRGAVRGHLGEFGYRRTISGVVYEDPILHDSLDFGWN